MLRYRSASSSSQYTRVASVWMRCPPLAMLARVSTAPVALDCRLTARVESSQYRWVDVTASASAVVSTACEGITPPGHAIEPASSPADPSSMAPPPLPPGPPPAMAEPPEPLATLEPTEPPD